MAWFLHPFDTFTLRRKRHILLALSWMLGLGLGALVFRYEKQHITALMPSVLCSQSSIIGLAASALLPFLLSAVAVYLSFPLFLIPICFSKAFLYAYISCGIYHFFCSAGWLIHGLLLFVDTLSIPVLYLYWLRHISGFRYFHPASTGIYFAALVLIITLGYHWIMPLTVALSF